MIIDDRFFENALSALPEIDDVHHADALLNLIRGADPEARVLRAARVLAMLREFYVNVGREIETNASKAAEED